MILESNLLAKLQVGEKMLSHGLNTLHFDGTTDAQKHFLESSQFSELVEKVFVDNMLIGH
jgi:hypothetical protein